MKYVLALTLLFIPLSFATAQTTGLVAHYTFDDGTATDVSGNGNNGTISGATSVAGKIGQALSFDGVDDSVTVPNSSSLSALGGSSRLTVTFWIKRTGTASNYLTIWGNGRLFDIRGDIYFPVRPQWRYGGTGNAGSNLDHFCPATTCPLSTGEWHHLVVMYSDPTSYIYINGNLVSEKSGTGGALNSAVAEALKIGSAGFAGILDDVRVYNRALTVAEISGLYTSGGSGGSGGGGTTPPPPDEPEPPVTSSTLTVKKDGTGNFSTIQACANAVTAGKTCLVYPGTYSERVTTASGGSGEQSRVTFKAEGVVTMQGFVIKHPYVTVEGFDITGAPTAYSGHIDVQPDGNYCRVEKNVIRDGLENVSGIRFYNTSGRTPGNCVVSGNTLKNLLYTFLSIQGSNHLFENNKLERVNSRDYLYVFGNGHIFRRNIFREGNLIAGNGNHPDWVQTFGDNGQESYNMLFEENWIEDFGSQLGQMNSGGGSRGIMDNIHSWTFRRNVFVNIGNNMNASVANVKWENNTFYRFAYTQNGLSMGGSLTRGESSRNVLMNNIFLAGGYTPTTPNDIRGFYSLTGASLTKEVIAIFATGEGAAGGSLSTGIMSDLVTNGYLVNTNGAMTNKARALTDISQFILNSTYASYKSAVYDLLVRTAALDKLTRDTVAIDYNYVAGAAPTYYTKRADGCTEGIFTPFKFCEVHGINGGNPLLQNISSPAGPDGIPFTLDDGLKPMPGSPLCGKGNGGTDIGAYSCSASVVFAGSSGSVIEPDPPPPPPPPPPTGIKGDFNNDGVVNSVDFSLLAGAWNTSNSTYDLNTDTTVNTLDYSIMAQNWTR